MSFTGFNWVLLGFTGFYWVLVGSIEFYWVLLGYIRCSRNKTRRRAMRRPAGHPKRPLGKKKNFVEVSGRRRTR